MVGTRVTLRYARALFELAEERKLLSKVEQDLTELLKVYETSPDFRAILESPVIQSSKKKDIFTELFKDKLNPLTFRFLILLVTKNRENFLQIIITRFMDLLDEAKGIIRGQLFTAYPFSDQQLTTLKKRLDKITEKNVVIEQKVEPELLGGFVIRMNDTVVDTSLKNNLAKLRARMISGN